MKDKIKEAFDAWWKDYMRGVNLPVVIPFGIEAAWQAARLSSAKEIAEKDERIKALELETKSLLEILISEGLQYKHQARIERIFEESAQRTSKKEST